MQTIGAIVIEAMDLIEKAMKATKDHGEYVSGGGYDPSAFDFAARALNEINLASVPDHELTRPITEMRNLIVEAKDLPPAIHKRDGRLYGDPEKLRESLRRVRHEADRHTHNVEAAVNRVRDELGRHT